MHFVFFIFQNIPLLRDTKQNALLSRIFGMEYVAINFLFICYESQQTNLKTQSRLNKLILQLIYVVIYYQRNKNANAFKK